MDWKYLVWDDRVGYGQVLKIMTYEAEQNFLNFLGDIIITPEFQLNTAKLAVLKNNYKYIQKWIIDTSAVPIAEENLNL
ncbi:hypothetical protein [Spiroplasma taiwanense]|uniref:Uncharacterized protein n=1 Tax=Spiroplasma taiwanense CT-1 TaxID=1276220 RepID=S5LWB2_9MOLU|nr:hypothetical protein [Spiroplasma taiwanense]AGR40901.1 hypothetical protein STAIW_v1c02300 [Spiroplasma taiwanense CT-1]